MKNVNEIQYKGFAIVVFLHDDYRFSCSTAHLRSDNPVGGINHTFPDANGAIKDIQTKIDKFIASTPSTWTKLAEAIEASLIWDGYEDCHVSPKLLRILVENFNKARGIHSTTGYPDE